MTREVFLKNGNGATINARLKDDLVAKATFKVITEDLEMSLEKGSSEILPDISGQQ